MAGLSAGIALACKGFETEIFERSSIDMQNRGAGLVIQPEMRDYMLRHHITTPELFGTSASQTQYLDASGAVVQKYYNGFPAFTSWSHVWRQLKSFYPENKYHFNHQLRSISDKSDRIEVTFTNGRKVQGDLLIGADGYESVVRSFLYPTVKPRYAGYTVYRGLVAEDKLSAEERAFFEDKMTFYNPLRSVIIAYMVPGENGELIKGKRQLNWAWAANKTQVELEAIMLDKNSVQRHFSVPQGLLSEESVGLLRQQSVDALPSRFSEIIRKTQSPFAQAIVDLSVPEMYRDRTVLIGDAAFVVRPHTASGTAKASKDAIELAEQLSGSPDQIGDALRRWNEVRKIDILDLAQYGRDIADRIGLGF